MATPDVIIDEDLLNEILKEFAYPVLDAEDLPYTEEQIRKLFIWPAMREYFRYYPLLSESSERVNGTFSINFPDTSVFNIINANLNTNTATTGSIAGSDPLVNASNILSIGQGNSRYGTPFNYGVNQAFHSRRSEYNAMKLSQAATRIKVDPQTRKVYGYANVGGYINITWASWDSDFGYIPFEKIEDVIKLCVSNIYQGWGNMLSLQSSELSNELNADFMLERAETLKTEVVERWNAITKPILIRKR